MKLLDQIIGPNNENLARLSKDLSLTPDESVAILRAVMPELSRNMERETLSRGGLASLIQSLGDGRHEAFLDTQADLNSPAAVEQGNAILNQILHSKYQSRALADRVETETGVPAAKTRKMLPRIANVSMAALQQQTRPAIQDIFNKLPGFPGSTADTKQTQPSGGSPLPIPGDDWGGESRNGYDDLSDVLRRKQRPFQSNPLWAMVRQVLGSVLGFQSNGVMGYIIRFIIYRYGWTILRMIFGRLFRA